MAKNANQKAAKEVQNDEFYTQYDDIQKEIDAYLEYTPDLFRGKTILLPCNDPEWSNFTKFFAQNFESLGLRRLISTSFDWAAKIFTLTCDNNRDSRINIHHLGWRYLEGSGDFRSDEVISLRDEADLIITHPPSSLFHEFIDWLIESGKQFAVIGNINALSSRNIFLLIQSNRIWLGATGAQLKTFTTPTGAPLEIANTCWYTNIDHGSRHQRLPLTTMLNNILYSRHPLVHIRCYLRYDNYDAIDVPYIDDIPSDYDGIIGVPITFLDNYCPEQFEILGITDRDSPYMTKKYTRKDYPNYSELNRGATIRLNSNIQVTYTRLLIRKRRQQ